MRVPVPRTPKLFIGGAFPRSESGRTYEVAGTNVAQASRKDVRDAVAAARTAFGGWAAKTAYNRGQVCYRVAEIMEGRRAQFLAELGSLSPQAETEADVDAAVDRWVWYAGWADKLSQVAGGANAVAGPYFNFSVPEPAGVVGVLAPQESPLLGLVSVLAPVVVTGNAAVVVASEDQPLPAVTLAEVLAASDVPGGVVNVLTGRTAELAPVLAAHRDVDAIDLTGAPADAITALEKAAAGNVKRLLRPAVTDWHADPGTTRLLAFMETKTVWHPVGL